MDETESTKLSTEEIRSALQEKIAARSKVSTSYETMADQDPIGTEQKNRGSVKVGGSKSTTEAIASQRLGESIDEMSDEEVSKALSSFREDGSSEYSAIAPEFKDNPRGLLRALNKGRNIIN